MWINRGADRSPVLDTCQLIRERLRALGRDQKELAAAAEVTESYVSQLLSRRKSPPAPERTDIYEKMEAFLNLPAGRLAELARHDRLEEVKRSLGSASAPLNPGVRDFVLFKCKASSEPPVRSEFGQRSFGLLERVVTQTLMDVAKDEAREMLRDDAQIQAIAVAGGRSFEDARVTLLDFLDADVFHLTVEHCRAYLDPLIRSWSVDLERLRIDVVLDPRFGRRHCRRFELVESGEPDEEPGFKEFLRNATLRGDATEEELTFLRNLRFRDRRPTAFYYYRELQNLRDPLHFRERGKNRRTREPSEG